MDERTVREGPELGSELQGHGRLRGSRSVAELNPSSLP